MAKDKKLLKKSKPSKPYDEIHVSTWKEFTKCISDHKYREWIYRGQSDYTWELNTSIERLFDKGITLGQRYYIKLGKLTFDKRSRYESKLLDEFIRTAHLYIDSLPKKKNALEWLSIMQHYGVPTRLLDFTYSPYIAAFFAVESGESDAAIYALSAREFDKADKAEELVNSLKDHKAVVFDPAMNNERLLAQQGLFLFPNTHKRAMNEIIREMELEKDAYLKIIISSEMRKEAFIELKKMNITSTTIYPGLSGFCKSLPWMVFED